MVLEDRSYQTQYFANIFPSPLTSTLHIHFYLHIKESSENALWIAIALKSTTFSAPERAPETSLETMYFMLLLKNLRKSCKKADCSICFDRIDQFYTCSFPCLLFLLLLGGGGGGIHSHAWLEKNCVYEAALLFFSQNTSDLLYLLKILLELFFAVMSSQNLKIQMKIASHAWLEIAPSENFFAFQNNKEYKTADLSMSSYD